MTHLQRDGGRKTMSSGKVWSLDLTSAVETQESWRHRPYCFLSETDSKIHNEGDLSKWTVSSNRQRVQARRCYSLAHFLRGSCSLRSGSDKIILMNVFILLWGTWAPEIRSHKASDRVKTRTKLFLLLQNSSIQKTSSAFSWLYSYPIFTGKKEQIGVNEMTYQYVKVIFQWSQNKRWKLCLGQFYPWKYLNYTPNWRPGDSFSRSLT